MIHNPSSITGHRTQVRGQSGQSLIETIVAIFVLTTALTAGLGLTIYAFSSSTTSLNEIIATNLAREGIEVVRMMRDSNWLAADASGGVWDLTNCSDLANRFCYPDSYKGPTYAILSPPYTGGNSRAIFNPATSAWSLDSTADYNLYLQADGGYTHTNNSTLSTFARQINITLNSTAPYTAANPELIIKSAVAWRGKTCTDFASADSVLTLSTPCKVVVEEHLTNWKDYK